MVSAQCGFLYLWLRLLSSDKTFLHWLHWYVISPACAWHKGFIDIVSHNCLFPGVILFDISGQNFATMIALARLLPIMYFKLLLQVIFLCKSFCINVCIYKVYPHGMFWLFSGISPYHIYMLNLFHLDCIDKVSPQYVFSTVV